MKVRTFEANSTEQLQEFLNTWLEFSKGNSEIAHIEYSTYVTEANTTKHFVLIFYKKIPV